MWCDSEELGAGEVKKKKEEKKVWENETCKHQHQK